LARALVAGHEKYRRRSLQSSRGFLRTLASDGQSPDVLFVGCSDSRVVPELLTNSNPGDLFVVRNIANVVPPLDHADSSVGAAIEYAVGHLGVAHVVVCGHTRCGGVRAAMTGLTHAERTPSLAEWVALIRASAGDASAAGDPWRQAVCDNVRAQLDHLLSYPCVADAVEADRLELHAWVYDLDALDLLAWDDEADAFVPASTLA
jgi:carbonic anhydrase